VRRRARLASTAGAPGIELGDQVIALFQQRARYRKDHLRELLREA
jgi:hypothetical protein